MRQLTTILCLCVLACDPGGGPQPDCTVPDDCDGRGEKICDSVCPGEVQQLCVAGECQSINSDLVAVSADVSLHFSLTGEVESLIFVFVDPRAAKEGQISCSDLLANSPKIMASEVNSVSVGFVNFQATTGTAFFPDSNLGSVPHGEYLLFARGFSRSRGAGELKATTCVDDLSVRGSDPIKLALTLAP